MMKLLFYKICCNSWPPKTLKKNHLKTNNQPETKKIFELKSILLGAFKVRKHILLTSLIIWNILT